ncbi:alginate biosynthesis protein AlgP [Deinococcus sp.]|uniref:alginate biosynthesis protein AlgP n=1 Tax=Deinococcus sp. TaxID=47478 RepID=UPI0025B87E10|nr:alginate biosynthesis protein AlgP [Deinococcus sp.]
MTNESTGGVSKRSLVLLGAFAALALNRDLRRNLVLGTRDALDSAQSTLNETVKPALGSVAEQAHEAAALAAHQASDTWGSLREDAPQRAHSLLSTAQSLVGTAAEHAAQLRKEAEQAAEQARREYAPKLGALQDDLLDTVEDRRKLADRAVKGATRKGQQALAELSDRASTLRDTAGHSLESQRRDVERAIARARRDAERELRAQKKNWNQKKLEAAIEKRIAPVHQQVQREFARLEKQVGRNPQRLIAELRPAPKKSGMDGGLTALALLGTGIVVLARVPAARQGVLNAVEAISPDAAKQLHSFSKQVRDIVGSAWIETIEEPAQTPAPGAAKSTQAATTGATWGATVEPGSAAAASTNPASSGSADSTPAQSNQGTAPATNTTPNTSADSSSATAPKDNKTS